MARRQQRLAEYLVVTKLGYPSVSAVLVEGGLGGRGNASLGALVSCGAGLVFRFVVPFCL